MTDKNPQTRARILREFANLCYEQGFEKTTMRQLGDRCGMSHGHINFYYNKKIDLAMALFKTFSRRINLVVEKKLGIPEDQVTAFFLHFLMESFLISHSPIIYRVASDMGNNAEYIKKRVELLKDAWRRTLTAARVSFDDESIQIGCICAGNSIYAMLNYWCHRYQSVDYLKFFQTFHEVLLTQSGLNQLAGAPQEALRLFETVDKALYVDLFMEMRHTEQPFERSTPDRILASMWSVV